MKTRRIISLLLVISLLFAMFAIPASAATSGSNKTTSIYVTTKANWLKPGSESITLTPSQGVARNGTKFNGSWSVAVYRYGHGTTKYYTLKSSALKINLARNASYKITVSPTPAYKAVSEINRTQGALRSYPSWRVSKTHKVSSIG